MWRTLVFVLVSMISICLYEATCSDNSGNLSVDCYSKYVAEGKSLECDCNVASDSPVAELSLTWPGFSNTSKLKVTNVKRSDNGTVFTCLMTWRGHLKRINYTLEVAYGPDHEHTRICGSSPFITDGTKNLTLTCEADEVHPRPLYAWEGVDCHNSNKEETCVLQPKPPWDDGRVVQCTTTSSFVKENMGKATYFLNLTYPPLKPPEIQGKTTGQVLKKGDRIQCRVSGGKPSIKRVIFSCFSDPPHGDQEDVTEGMSVLSSVIIINAATPGYSVMCACSAVWEPEETLYAVVSNITVFVESDDKDEHLKTTITSASCVFLLLIIAVVFAVYFKKRDTRKDLRNHLLHPTSGFTQDKTAISDEGLYCEIEIPSEGVESTGNHHNVLADISALTLDILEDNENPVFTQSTIRQSSLDERGTQTEELELYNTLQPR